ncbi:hypothetical protein BH11ACT8_BH11ACT8_03170 [soil metagenome]
MTHPTNPTSSSSRSRGTLRRGIASVLVLSAATAVSFAATPVADASGSGSRVVNSGACDAGALWKIKAKPDDGRIEVEAEIDSNVAGQRWTWVLKHNGSRSAKGSSQTVGRSGSFSVGRRTVDASGTDRFVFRATHGSQTCVARLSL